MQRRATETPQVESFRNEAIRTMVNALDNYGLEAANLSADLFSDVMEIAGLSLNPTVHSGIISMEEIRTIAHYQATKLMKGDVDGFIAQMAGSTGFMVRQAANGTVMSQSALVQYRGGWTFKENLRGGKGRAVWSYSTNHSSNAYQIRYMRLPQGMETCDFCLMLASRGPVYLTAESAEGWNHTHRGCDCIVVPCVVHKEADKWVPDIDYEGFDMESMTKVLNGWDGIRDHEGRLDVMEEVLGRREW